MKRFLLGYLMALSVLTVALAAKLGENPALPPTLTDSYGKVQKVEDNQYRVFFFYPRAGTSGCTTQNIEYTKRYAEFLELNTQVFGVSSDDAKSQCAFIAAQKLKVPQIPDQRGELAKLFEIGNFLGMFSRDTVIVAPNGKLVAIHRNVNPVSDASEVLRYIKSGDCKAFTSGQTQCMK
jgi:thioredoxin-dependent peroxiredoxin